MQGDDYNDNDEVSQPPHSTYRAISFGAARSTCPLNTKSANHQIPTGAN